MQLMKRKALLAAEPNLAIPFPSEYLQPLRHGMLVLVAADKFMEQIAKDMKESR